MATRPRCIPFWAIAGLGVIVWAHHMFTSGMSIGSQIYFMYITMAISFPLAVLFFCWIASVWKRLDDV
jgi:cytochrome c oxidase subunit 1